MVSFERIAFCTDFSQGSEFAFKVAEDFVRERNAELYIIHSIPPIAPTTPIADEFVADRALLDQSEDIDADAEKKIRRMYVERLEGVERITIRILRGQPANEINQFARANDIDLIVMGSLGLSGLARVLLGSTTQKVMRKAPCSVLAVRPRKDS
jgi:nucleotide-binding universal stress UspA family protein